MSSTNHSLDVPNVTSDDSPGVAMGHNGNEARLGKSKIGSDRPCWGTMDFADILARRRMVRRYQNRPVPDETVSRILARGVRHPTAGFSQGIHLVAVTGDRRASIAAAAGEAAWVAKGYEPWLSSAPVHIVICADPEAYHARYAEPDKQGGPSDWPVPYWWVDAGAALMLLLLAAGDEGLDAGFLGAHRLVGIDRVLGLPERVEPVGLVTIGFGADDPVVGSRSRPRRDIVHREHW